MPRAAGPPQVKITTDMPPHSDSSGCERCFSLRIVSLDYYLAPPIPGLDAAFSSLEGTAVDSVPIVRVFGSTPTGQRACLHLHQAYPYFYVPYASDLPSEPTEVLQFLRRLALALDSALNMSGGLAATAAAATAAVGGGGSAAHTSTAGPAQASSAAAAAGEHQPRPGRPKKQHVADLLVVRARPMYGYYADDCLFIKVVLYNPQDVSRASLLLGSGAILGRRFQPYEAHIPFLLQLKIDLNLVGMGWMQLDRVLFRPPLGTPPPTAAAGAGEAAAAETPAAAAAAAAGLSTVRCCSAAEPCGCWDPWRADSAANVAYGPQPQPAKPQGLGPGQPTHTLQGPGQQGSGGQGSGGSGGVGSQGVDGVVWCEGSVPGDWTWEAFAAEVGCPTRSIPARQSCCMLEADAAITSVLNRRELLTVDLADAPPDLQLVSSLVPMWQQERWRLGAASIPPPPASPRRRPLPLCPAVEAVREEFRAISQQAAAQLAALKARHQQQQQQLSPLRRQ